MSGFDRQSLRPAQPLRAPIDLGEWEGRAQVRERTQKMVCPPVIPQPEFDPPTLRLLWFRSQPPEEQERILAAEQEHREQAERERLEAARQAEAERLAGVKS